MDFLNQWVIPPGATAPSWLYISVAILALLFTAVSKGGFGGGAGTVSVPLMLQVAPLKFTIGLWLPILIICDIFTIRQYPQEWRWRGISRTVLATVVGVLLAALLLYMLKGNGDAPGSSTENQLKACLKLGVAAISFVFLFLWLYPIRPVEAGPWQPDWGWSGAAGVSSGTCSTLAHAAGPIMTLYLLAQKMDQREFAGTAGRYFFGLNTLKVPFLLAAGVITFETLRYGAWLMLLSPLGVWLGAWLNKKISATWFLRVVYFFLAVAAFKLAYDALPKLLG
jgi:uncharacterized membrane protein YfcA